MIRLYVRNSHSAPDPRRKREAYPGRTHQDDPLDPILGGNLGILQTLDPFDQDRQLRVFPDKFDIVPDEVVVLIRRDRLSHAHCLFGLFASCLLVVLGRRWRWVDRRFGTLIKCPLGCSRSVYSEHDPGTTEVSDLFQEFFRSVAVLVQVDLCREIDRTH